VIDGRTFRLAAVPSHGGWLVAGESVAKLTESGGDVLLVELVLGALLLLVTFAGSFVVGLRASAPIEQVRKRQAEFTADASHELRTPLSVIEAEVDLALGRPRAPEEYAATLERIGSESHRLRAIVEDLLWLARADGVAPDPGRLDTVDVAAVADASVVRFAAVADSGSVTLTAHTVAAGTARVRGDAEGIDRLVAVLVDNACKHAGVGGTVEVGVQVGGGRVVLSVGDSGPGIPEAHRDLVFDRFHRADTSSGGTGLGLAIADAVVHASSGTWAVGTSPLGGARFSVTWRQAPREADDGPTVPAAREAGTPAGARLGAG
jgi:signal transduction histidine kinase